MTICAYEQACVFGRIRNDQMTPNALGRLALSLWLQIPVVRANTELDAYVMMPNHLHGIIRIVEIKSIEDSLDTSAARLPSGSLGAIIGQYKSLVTKRSRQLPCLPTFPIWQRNYYEHIIRHENALNQIRKYIMENPGRWAEDDLYAE